MVKGDATVLQNQLDHITVAPRLPRKSHNSLGRYWDLYFIMVPGILYFILFKYVPMWGAFIAFQDYSVFAGILKSEWVGLAHFKAMYHSTEFFQVFRNTLLISLYKLIWGFPGPIILALMLNELRHLLFKRTVQTLVYLPHFLSWVIVGGMMINVLSPSTGIVNELLKFLGLDPIFFMADENWFRSILVVSDIWKSVGWGAIIYLAALAGINPQLYEAATVDGANKWNQLRHVTFPAMLPTITILFLLNLSNVLDVGFEQIFILYNPLVYSVGDVIETYVYRVGISQGEFSYTTAVGLFKSVIALIFVILANKGAKRLGQEGIW